VGRVEAILQPISPLHAHSFIPAAARGDERRYVEYATPARPVQSVRPESCIQYGTGSGSCAIERVGVESRHKSITKVLGCDIPLDGNWRFLLAGVRAGRGAPPARH